MHVLHSETIVLILLSFVILQFLLCPFSLSHSNFFYVFRHHPVFAGSYVLIDIEPTTYILYPYSSYTNGIRRMVDFIPFFKCRYLSLKERTHKPPLIRTFVFPPFRACVGARDPYCGWDLLLKKCTTLEKSVRMSQWEQSITKCPVSINKTLHNFP